MFCPNSVAVARYSALIRTKSPTNCDAHLAESLFQTRSSHMYFLFFYFNILPQMPSQVQLWNLQLRLPDYLYGFPSNRRFSYIR
ncbi:MAG: DUF6783 domain-containing protein [Ruminococcus sp.]